MATIINLYEKRRGCGFRKPGGKYLVLFGSIGRPCGRLPIPLVKCPCCGGGIGRSSWPTMIQAGLLLQYPCKSSAGHCVLCPLSGEEGLQPNDPVLLLWVGERYYRTTEDFDREANVQGISRRITQVPKGFEIGKTWVALGHANAITEVNDETGAVEQVPGVFRLFKPEALQYVVTDQETEEELDRLEKQGFQLVRVHRLEEQAELFEQSGGPFDDGEFTQDQEN